MVEVESAQESGLSTDETVGFWQMGPSKPNDIRFIRCADSGNFVAVHFDEVA